jgi:hypothetical protein
VEDFFASSPSANLVGINEEGHVRFFPKGCGQCASQPFLSLLGVIMKPWIRNLLIVASLLIFALAVSGQDPQPEDDFQSWNDVQLTVPLSPKLDFQTQFTARLGKNVTRLNDGRFLAGLVYKPHKSFSINPFYWSIWARNAVSVFRFESRYSLRLTYRFPVKPIGLSHRSQFEYRVRGTAKSWRYRASLNLEKDLPKKFNGKFFIADEVFYDSTQGRFSRNRFSIGINKIINKDLSLDLYYMRQNDGVSRPGDLHTIWTALRVRIGGE